MFCTSELWFSVVSESKSGEFIQMVLAPDKRGLYCSSNIFSEVLLMSTNNICFHKEIRKNFCTFSLKKSVLSGAMDFVQEILRIMLNLVFRPASVVHLDAHLTGD